MKSGTLPPIHRDLYRTTKNENERTIVPTTLRAEMKSLIHQEY